MKRYNQLLKYISKNYSGYVFISIFYSLWLINKYISTFNPELQFFSGRMISEATLQGYDISKRIQAFYQAGVLFLLSTVFFSIAAWRVSSFLKGLFKSPELKIINYTSLVGMILCFCTLWGSSVNTSLELIYCIHKTALLLFIAKRFVFKNIANTQHISIPFYSIAFVGGISFFFLWNEIAVLFHLFPTTDLLLVSFVFMALSSLWALQHVKRKTFLDAKNSINHIAYLFVPVAFIPLLSFFKDEIYLILNKHQVYYLSPSTLYTIGLLAISGWIAGRYLRSKKQLTLAFAKNTYQLMGTRYFPLLVLGLVTYTFYNPIIHATNEMFEAGNRFLPLMEYQKFSVIPILEKFNAHQLFELFWGAIYVFLNGLNGREMLIYDFMDMVVWAFLVYWIIYKMSHNPYVALFITLLFPLTDELIHLRHSIAFITVFILHIIIYQKASLKNYLLLFTSAAFLILWRMDIGYPSLIAIVGTLLIYWLNKKASFDLKLFLKSIIIFSITCFLLMGLIVWYRDVNVYSKLWNGLNYLASAQSYGYVNLGDQTSLAFKMQYFVFPLIILLGFCTLLAFFQRYTISKSQRFVYTLLLFLAIYYFVNFQRGIVAHTFAAGSDGWLSPSLFFILSVSVYLFLYKKSQLSKFIVFTISAVFLIINYKYPAVAGPQNIYSQTINKASSFSALKPDSSIVRCIDNMKFEEQHFGNFKKLIDERLTEKQTFIDFSNTPMLYYFTGKPSPSYFYQNPLTIHNDYLQNNFISELKNYDAPLIAFSSFPETYWDNVNGVPNGIRHYRMSEYFYTNYQPFAMIDNLCIWKQNGFNLKNNERTIYQYRSSNDSVKTQLLSGRVNSNDKNYLFKVNSSNEQMAEISIHTENKNRNIHATFIDQVNHMGYYILDSVEKGFSFQLKNSDYITAVYLYECDYIPDFYSAYPKNFSLNQLPYIWGKYDDSVHHENVILNLLAKPDTLTNTATHYYNFSPDIDKSSGNTMLISLECDNEIPVSVTLMYGSKSGYKGAYVFSIPAGKGIREFAIRMSAQYNWYSSIEYIGLNCQNIERIALNSIKLLKGK